MALTTLFIDGSSQATLIGLTPVGLTPGSYRELPGKAPSDGVLFAALRELLLEVENLEAIAVGSGPGSHTGTRAAAAAAKGLALGLGLPLKLFPSLLLLLPKKEGRIATSLPTRTDKIYFLIYDTNSVKIEFYGLLAAEEMSAKMGPVDHYGHDFSPHHLPRFLEKAPPSPLETPLNYLQL